MAKSSRSLDRQFVKGGATTLILTVLAETPTYGYELIQTIRQRSEGIFDFSDGTVYPLLYNLRDRGWVSSEIEVSAAGRERKIYHITPEGRAALDDLIDDWKLFARGMKLSLAAR